MNISFIVSRFSSSVICLPPDRIGPMFTPEQRSRLRSSILEYAASDSRISGAAITGSAAAGCEDEWSDIDLAFGVIDAVDVPNVLSDWTRHMYEQHRALHHVDVRFGAWIYRVFLLPDTLQVDLAFAPTAEFRALSPAFRLVFGRANAGRPPAPQPVSDLIGMGWLYALHARSCIARGKEWQAEYMISGIRDSALALACIHCGVPAVHGRGFDQLPRAVTAPLEGSLVQGLATGELARAFQVAVDGLLGVIGAVDEELAGRLRAPLTSLTGCFSL
jgi:hypothetical protein